MDSASAGLISAVASAQAETARGTIELEHQPAQVHQEHDVPQRHQQVAHRAGPQEGQGAFGDIGEGNVGVLQLEPLRDAAHGQRHNEQQNAHRRRPEMGPHEFRERKLLPHELRHDVIDRPEHHHGEEAVGIQQALGRR